MRPRRISKLFSHSVYRFDIAVNYIEIITDRLTLKPLGQEYLQTVNEYALDRENTKYMLHLPNETEAETALFLKSTEAEWKNEAQRSFEFAVIFEGRHIGAVSIYIENGIGELGWILNRKFQGNGFALEAAKSLIEYFSDNMGIVHFTAHCDTENTASSRVMEKLGMTKTGEWGGRRNRSADRDSFECRYELHLR